MVYDNSAGRSGLNINFSSERDMSSSYNVRSRQHDVVFLYRTFALHTRNLSSYWNNVKHTEKKKQGNCRAVDSKWQFPLGASHKDRRETAVSRLSFLALRFRRRGYEFTCGNPTARNVITIMPCANYSHVIVYNVRLANIFNFPIGYCVVLAEPRGRLPSGQL